MQHTIFMPVDQILDELKSHSNPENLEGMARFGISTDKAYGISIPVLRKIAKQHKNNHQLALSLWDSGYHEARILASMIDDPQAVTETQMDEWVRQFNSWDLCDQCCGNLFDKTPYAYAKAIEWSGKKEEFVKRAGFATMAWLAVHDKKAGAEQFIAFFPYIEREASDSRNFVKKAVNWALRQIGKRNLSLNRKAIEIASRIQQQESKSARWIATDALRELNSDKVQVRLQSKARKLKKTL